MMMVNKEYIMFDQTIYDPELFIGETENKREDKDSNLVDYKLNEPIYE